LAVGSVSQRKVWYYLTSSKDNYNDESGQDRVISTAHTQTFNMSGYSAPKIDTVRIGFIGLGNRGPGHTLNMSLLEGVDIKALCDIVPEQAEKAKKDIEFAGFNPTLYSGDADAWKKLCDRDDIDLVYICTPWNLHTPMAVYAMEHGKHVAIEVPGADNLEECWQLVETSEKTRMHCQMMENWLPLH
jgi:predicted dehydrogenase